MMRFHQQQVQVMRKKVKHLRGTDDVWKIESFRVFFNWVSKVIPDYFVFTQSRSVIGAENSRHSLNQSDAKLSHELVAHVFPRFWQSDCFYFEFS